MHNMKKVAVLLSAATASLAAAPAFAEMPGNWHVTGDIDGKAFAVDCKFAPQGKNFGGACVDAATGDAKVKAGKTHVLKQGTVIGNQVHWTYPTKVMFMSIDIDFAGTMSGNRITGKVSAKGREGTFTAVRK